VVRINFVYLVPASIMIVSRHLDLVSRHMILVSVRLWWTIMISSDYEVLESHRLLKSCVLLPSIRHSV